MIKVDEERCKCCKICIKYCPQQIIKVGDRISNKGYHIVELTNLEKCNACGICALVCPDAAISVYK